MLVSSPAPFRLPLLAGVAALSERVLEVISDPFCDASGFRPLLRSSSLGSRQTEFLEIDRLSRLQRSCDERLFQADMEFKTAQDYLTGFEPIRAVPSFSQAIIRDLASRGYANAQYAFGLDLAHSGRRRRGVAWIRKAADRGHADALASYGRCLIGGLGVSQNQRLGFKKLEESIRQRSKLGLSMYWQILQNDPALKQKYKEPAGVDEILWQILPRVRWLGVLGRWTGAASRETDEKQEK
jgi:TPR repeat protein